MNAGGSRWSLDPAAFDRLLAFLDPDRQSAALKYEDVRTRLMKLFTWRGCASPEDYADRTIDRVARRIAEGAAIEVPDPFSYFHGVAMNVLREHWREQQRSPEPLTMDVADTATSTAGQQADDDRAATERRVACLEQCLDRMPPRQREMLIEYHTGDRHIERRRALAAALAIPLNALRIRMHRLRTAVEACISRCERLFEA